MRIVLVLLACALLAGCGTPYGIAGSMGGIKLHEHSLTKVEIMVLGSDFMTYEHLAKMWKAKADETARLRGATSYEVVSFSTGREFLGVEIMGEGSFIERYADDMVFWLPKIARGVIKMNSTSIPAVGQRRKI